MDNLETPFSSRKLSITKKKVILGLSLYFKTFVSGGNSGNLLKHNSLQRKIEIHHKKLYLIIFTW